VWRVRGKVAAGLVEILVVILIIAVLAALVFTGTRRMILKRKMERSPKRCK